MMDNNNLYEDYADEMANNEFQKLFYSKFRNCKLRFKSDSMLDCLYQVARERKPLIIVLHDENNEDSQKCCKLLSKEAITDFISKHFSIVGWKLNNNDEGFTKGLADSASIIQNFEQYVLSGTPCIFIIVPNKDYIKVHNELKINEQNMDKSDWLLIILKETQKLMSSYVKEIDFANMTSIKYQQHMYEELGDRDYDSFENDEHKILEDKLLFAMFGPPLYMNGYQKEQKEAIKPIYDIIRKKNNEFSKWNDRIVMSFIYNCFEPTDSEKMEKAKVNKDYNKEQDFCPVPVFVIRKCKVKKEDRMKKWIKPCRTFIDSSCRVYSNWTKYLEENILPPGEMIYPEDGKYQNRLTNSYKVWLERSYTPNSSETTKVLQYVDVASGISSIVSGAILTATSFTPLGIITIPAVATGAITSVYSIIRGVDTLVDRNQHEQSLSITDSQSCGAYLNIVGSTVGFASAGSTFALSTFARQGAKISKGAIYTVNAIKSAEFAISAAGTGTGFFDAYKLYKEEGVVPSTLTKFQLAASSCFFLNSIRTFSFAGKIVKKHQTIKLNEIELAVQSDRQRKMFNKLLKETTRVQGNRKGRAEVISTMRHHPTRDNILNVLTRFYRNFNKNGIRFSAEGGGISLNGIPVDISEFGNVPGSQHNIFSESYPTIPRNYPTSTSANVKNKLVANIPEIFGPTDCGTAYISKIFSRFKEKVQRKIMKICEKFMNQVDVDCFMELKRLLPFEDVKITIIRYVANFICKYAEDNENDIKEFGFRNAVVSTNDIIKYVIDEFSHNEEEMMTKLVRQFHTWFAELLYEDELKTLQKKNRHIGPTKTKVDCEICKGYYYKEYSSSIRNFLIQF